MHMGCLKEILTPKGGEMAEQTTTHIYADAGIHNSNHVIVYDAHAHAYDEAARIARPILVHNR
jgi:hypothetical protein